MTEQMTEAEKNARRQGIEAAKAELNGGPQGVNPYEASAENHDDIQSGKLWTAWQDGYDMGIMQFTLFQ